MSGPRQIVLERTYEASPEELWDLWTTKQGIESWRGPEGFAVEVRKLELRPGGALEYAMTAKAPELVTAAKAMGVSPTNVVRGTFKELSKRRRLVYTNLADFIPGVKPYEVTIVVEFHTVPEGVRIVLTQDVMHDEQWTQRAMMGWTTELERLETALGSLRSRKPGGARKRKP